MVVPVTAGSVPNTRPPTPRGIATANANADGQTPLQPGQGQDQGQLLPGQGMVDPTLGGAMDASQLGLVAFGGLGADQFQFGSADMLFNTLGPSEQELLSSLNGDDAAFLQDVTTTTSDFPYWSSLSFAPGDLFAPFARPGQVDQGYFEEGMAGVQG